MSRRDARGTAVGHITCPNPVHSKPVIAVVRQKKNAEKTLYGYCYSCGFINLTLPVGQEFFLRNTTFWPKDAVGNPIPPAAGEIPDCVRLNRAWSPDSKKSVDEIDGNEVAEPPAEPTREPTEDKGPPGDASALASAAHQRKPKRGKGYLMPWEQEDED